MRGTRRGDAPPCGFLVPFPGLHRLEGKKRIAVDVEHPGFLFPLRPPESVDGRSDRNIHKPGFPEHPFPACARQAPGDSVRPQVNVSNRRLRNRFAVCDIGELESPAGTEHPLDLRENSLFVGT